MLGARPQPWTWEVVVSRHGGLLGNVTDELSNGRFVAAHGAALLKKLTWYHPGPGEPVVTLDSAVDGAALAAPILDVFNADASTNESSPSRARQDARARG